MIRFHSWRLLAWSLLVQTWRNKAALFWNLVLPLFFMVGLSYIFGGGESTRVTHIVPGILTINLIAASFFGVAFHMVSLREKSVYRRFSVTPVSTGTVIFAHAFTALVNMIVSAILQMAIAIVWFRIDVSGSLLEFAGALLLAAFAMIPLGLLIGSVAQDMKTAPVISNLVFFVMMFLSGAAMPLSLMPAWLQQLSPLLPSTYVVALFQNVILRGELFAEQGTSIAILILTGLVGFAVNVFLFRWESHAPINFRRLGASLACLSVIYAVAIAGRIDPQRTKAAAEVTTRATPADAAAAAAKNVNMVLRPPIPSRSTPVRHVLEGMTIIDGNGRRIERGRIVIDRGRIVEVATASTLEKSSADGPRTELTGMFVIPGLIDSHVHLGGSAGGSVSSAEFMPDRMIHDLQLYLAMGVTSFVSMTDDVQDLRSLRTAVFSGRMRSPRPWYSGPGITARDGHPARFFVSVPGLAARITRQVDSPDAAEAAVRELATLDVAVVKFYLDAGRSGESFPVLTEVSLRAGIATAHQLGLRTTVHVDHDKHARWAISAGADGLEHIPPDLSSETISLLIKQRCTLTPTLAASEGMVRVMADRPNIAPDIARRIDPSVLDSLASPASWIARVRSSPGAGAEYTRRHADSLDATRRAITAGVTIVAGSDAGNPASFHGLGLIRELELLVECGMRPAAAIRAATGEAARRLGTSDIGAISSGAWADLVVLGSDPENSIQSLRDIRAVYFAGQQLDLEALFDSSPGEWMPQAGIETN